MNREQADRILAITDNDCQIKGILENAAGQTCALGALLKFGGWSGSLVRFSPSDLHGDDGGEGWAFLERVYGLTYYEATKIMDRNDNYARPATRHKHIRKLVESWVTEDEPAT